MIAAGRCVIAGCVHLQRRGGHRRILPWSSRCEKAQATKNASDGNIPHSTYRTIADS